MFGIGLPELLVILAVALIVVGPEKLPGLAKSVAKQVFELKKTANSLKAALEEETKEKPLGLLAESDKDSHLGAAAAPLKEKEAADNERNQPRTPHGDVNQRAG